MFTDILLDFITSQTSCSVTVTLIPSRTVLWCNLETVTTCRDPAKDELDTAPCGQILLLVGNKEKKPSFTGPNIHKQSVVRPRLAGRRRSVVSKYVCGSCGGPRPQLFGVCCQTQRAGSCYNKSLVFGLHAALR